jgi:hypothetical protein
MAETIAVSFAVQLEDETSGAANRAASALGGLRDTIDGTSKSLGMMRRAQRDLKRGGMTKEATEMAAAIKAKETAIAQATKRYMELGGTFERVSKQTTAATAVQGGLLQQMQAAPGPLGQLAARFGGMGRALMAAGGLVAGVALLAMGLRKLVSAATGAATALARFAIATADARREELLHLEGLTKIRRWHGIAASSATVLRDRIDEVAGSVAIGRDKVSQYAQQLERMGLRGGEAREALEVMSITASAAGEGMAKRFAGMAAGAAATGRSIKGLADDFRARFGPIAERQMLSLSVQATKFRENLKRLFSGLRIEGFLRHVKSIADLFSQSSSSGKALKQIIEQIFAPIQKAVDVVAPLVKRFIQGIIIGSQEVIIAMKRVELWFVKTFGNTTILGNMDLTKAALTLGKVAAFGMAAGVAVLGTGLAIVVAEGVRFFKLIEGIFTGIVKLKDVLLDTDWKGVAGALVEGLASGIENGVSRIKGAVSTLARAAKEGLAGALLIRSPSKVFEGFGRNTSEGMAKGIDAGAPRVGRAAESMADEATGGVQGGAMARGDVSVSIGDVVITGANTDDARALAERVRDELASILDGIGIHMGAPA